jgi:hypothetical protein
MTERIPSCPTCNDKMEVGFTRSYGFIPVHWIAGEPLRWRWGGFRRGGAPVPILTIAARIAAIWHRMRGRLRGDVEGGPAKKFPPMVAASAAANHG